MTWIKVRYAGGFNPDLDDEIEKAVGQEAESAGYFIPTGERDLQFHVADDAADDIVAKVKAMGVRAVKETA